MKPSKLEQLRATRLPLLKERDALAGQIRDREAAQSEVTALVQEWRADASPGISYAVQAGDFSRLLKVRPLPDGSVDLGPVLAAVLGTATLARVLGDHAMTLPDASARTERAARLVEIAGELDRIEEAEEAEICRLEAEGLQPLRRGDARPEIVLRLRA